MSWSLARSSCSPRPGPGPVWSSTVNVVNPVMVNLVAGWPGPPPAPDPRLVSRPVSVMTGSFMDTDFCSAVTVPTLAVSQFEDFVTATPTSGFRDFESSFGGTIKNENEYENDFYDDLTEVRTEFGTIKNENEYENDFYDDLTEVRTDFDAQEVIFASSSSCSSESDNSSEGYPANFFQATESDAEAKELQPHFFPPPEVVRPALKPRPRNTSGSDTFSWDPNSKRSSSRASAGVKTAANNGFQRNGDLVNLRSSPPRSPSRSSSIGILDYKPEDYSDQGFSGPATPPAHQLGRDTFVTPSEETETGNTWSQRLLLSGVEAETWRDPEADQSPQRPRSESPSVEFVAVSGGGSGGEAVAVGSMVQLETATGAAVCGLVRYKGPDTLGVELEEEVRGGGSGWAQNRQLFSCAPGKGVFVPYSHVIPDPRFTESLPPPVLGQDFGPLDSPVVPGFCAPHTAVDSVTAICGRNKGIQGHQNSCYLDATLFSMFSFTSVFDSLLYRPRGAADIARYEEVQRCLKDEIVNPLRKSLFVRADKVMKLRTMLDNLSDVKGLMDQEKDPEEFLSSLLTQVMKVEPFLELSSGQTAHHYQLIVEKDPAITVPTVQDLFDQSFATTSCRVKLRRAPSVLILQMPRFGRQFKLYDRILPSQLLDVTDVVVSSPRQCVICGVLAEFECPACYGSHLGAGAGLASTAYCGACLQRTHQHKHRRHHHQERLDTPPGWDKQPQQPIPRIYMELIAVVCIETSHYVSFVRCGDTPQAPWCFFDSMADRKGEQNGYNIPELTPAAQFENLMSESFAEELRASPNMPLGDQAKRLVSDAYMCFYQSPDVKMYR